MTENTKTRRRELPVLGAAERAEVSSDWSAAAEDAVRIGVVTLGCDKNTVDSEHVLARLVGAGAAVRSGAEDVDVVVINTCGFIDLAKEESIAAILGAVRMKQQGAVRAVVAMGCLVQRYRTELSAEIPEVDLFIGLTDAAQLVPALRARGLLPARSTVPLMEQPLRVLSAAQRTYSSYLKISEGCDHTCAFCAIPLMRGRHRSMPMAKLVREAQELEAAGVVELNIVSQDTTWYGRDIGRNAAVAASGDADGFIGRVFDGMAGVDMADSAGRMQLRRTLAGTASPMRSGEPAARHGLLPALLSALLEATSIPWLRLFYMYPSGIHPELIELMAGEPRLLPYLDMPIQHGSDRVLRAMRRPERQATIRARVHWLRTALPELALRTTVIVGFPGETEADFEQLLELLQEIRFDRVGAFAYSPEESTPAAALPDQVPIEVRRERLELLLDVQRGISQERNDARIGREVDVLVDNATTGRTVWQAPDVDGVVELGAGSAARTGEFIRARITGAFEDDLLGEIVDQRCA